jgi:hypothetical protein
MVLLSVMMAGFPCELHRLGRAIHLFCCQVQQTSPRFIRFGTPIVMFTHMAILLQLVERRVFDEALCVGYGPVARVLPLLGEGVGWGVA